MSIPPIFHTRSLGDLLRASYCVYSWYIPTSDVLRLVTRPTTTTYRYRCSRDNPVRVDGGCVWRLIDNVRRFFRSMCIYIFYKQYCTYIYTHTSVRLIGGTLQVFLDAPQLTACTKLYIIYTWKVFFDDITVAARGTTRTNHPSWMRARPRKQSCYAADPRKP